MSNVTRQDQDDYAINSYKRSGDAWKNAKFKDEVIPGLYAAGNCSASISGQAYWGAGGTLGSPMTGSYNGVLQNIAADLEFHAKSFVNEEGRTGQLQKRFEDDRLRLEARSDLLTKEIGDQTDANMAEVSIRINTLLTQYEAAAKTFAELSQLSLLKYL